MDSHKKVTLHYFPASFYSQRVVVALQEKGVNYDEHFVNILAGDQFDLTFLKANNKGRVPVLEIDGEFHSESENIIDVIDKTFTSGPRLVPDVGSSIGDAVRDLRKLLYDVPVDQITYGVLANRKFMKDKSCARSFPPGFTKEGIKKKFLGEAGKLRDIRATCDPSLYEPLDEKIRVCVKRSVDFLDEDLTGQVLDDLETVFDHIEGRLEQTKRENPDADENCLIAPSFTAADISAATLCYRIELIGMAPRYFSDTIRPKISEYYKRLKSRSSMKLMIAKTDEMKKKFITLKLKSLGVKVLKVGFVLGLIGIGYMGYKSLTRGSKAS